MQDSLAADNAAAGERVQDDEPTPSERAATSLQGQVSSSQAPLSASGTTVSSSQESETSSDKPTSQARSVSALEPETGKVVSASEPDSINQAPGGNSKQEQGGAGSALKPEAKTTGLATKAADPAEESANLAERYR